MTTPGLLALAEAARHIGVEEYPPGSNRQPFGVWFNSNAVPWCAIFCSYVFHAAGVELCAGFDGAGVRPGKGCAWVPTIRAWLEARGWWRGPHETPEPGDLVLFDWGLDGKLDHIGIVERSLPPQIVTIEGNLRNGVGRMTRDTAHVAGYGRIGG